MRNVEASFRLTERSLKNLGNDEIPGEILKKLEKLEDGHKSEDGYFEEQHFFDAIEQKIGKDETVRYC